MMVSVTSRLHDPLASTPVKIYQLGNFQEKKLNPRDNFAWIWNGTSEGWDRPNLPGTQVGFWGILVGKTISTPFLFAKSLPPFLARKSALVPLFFDRKIARS